MTMTQTTTPNPDPRRMAEMLRRAAGQYEKGREREGDGVMRSAGFVRKQEKERESN